MNLNYLFISALIFTLGSAAESFASPAPNFEQIFNEINSSNTVTSAIQVRKKYLSQMQSISDFDRLTNLEPLEQGEQYFPYYEEKLGGFVVEHVSKLMLDARSKKELELFARRIIPKAYTIQQLDQLLFKGLFYVHDCADFQYYLEVSHAHYGFARWYKQYYCFM